MTSAATIGCARTYPAAQAPSAIPISHSPEPQAEAVWPAWRGGHRQGVSPTKTSPLHWTTTRGVRWRAEIPGSGNSSPAVWGARVYLTSAHESGEIILLCLDRSSGETVWQRPVARLQSRTHPKNGHASATVAVDGRRIYVRCGAAQTVCYSIMGDRLWETELRVLEHAWGSASSPVLHRDLVILLCDSPADSSLVALQRQTGRVVWRTPRHSVGNWTTPICVLASGPEGRREELIVNGTGASDGTPGIVISYDPSTGTELWRVAGTSGIPCPTLVAADNMVISASGGNGPVLGIRLGGRGDVSESHVLWKHSQGGPYVPTGVVVGDRYFSISDGGIASCWDVGAGQLMWRKRVGGTYSASLTAAAGRVYAVSEQGDVRIFAAADEYQLLATNAMGEPPCLATPAWAGAELLLRTGRHLYCIVGQTQETLASVPLATESEAAASPSDRESEPLPVSATSIAE